MNKANECTCPSGDGSLVHPCPAHPAVEQAGTNVGHGHVFPRADGVKMRCGGPALCSECAADAYRARAALAQPSPAQAEAEQPEIVAFRYRCTNAEGEPLPGWFYSDGAGTLGLREPLMAVSQHERIIGAMRAVVTQLRQHKNDYMDAGQETYRALQNEIREREAEIARLDGLVSGRTAERDAALAQPSGEVVVTKNESGAIVSVTRQDKEGRVLSVIAESATLTAQAEQAEAERPEGPTEDELEAAGLGYPLHKEEAVKLWYSGFRSEVITVLEAWEAIGHDTGINPDKEELLDSLRYMLEKCEAHDAALAEVAGLRSLLNSLLCYVERDIDRMRGDRDKSDNKEIYDRSISLAMERLKAAQNAVFTTEPGCDTAVELAAQTTQAQHSVPAYVSYTTRPAESLAGIALRQLKEESRWVEIRDINAPAFPDMQSHSYYPAGTVIKLPSPSNPIPQAWLDVQAERRRQVEAEGWTPEHDDEHNGGELADAAACYALWAGGINPGNWREFWPWAPEWLKHSEPRRMLVKAAALILAEIQRLDRAAAAGKEVGHE